MAEGTPLTNRLQKNKLQALFCELATFNKLTPQLQDDFLHMWQRYTVYVRNTAPLDW